MDALTCKLQRVNMKEQNEETLTKYLEVEAIEKEPQPKDSYCFSHHAVVKERLQQEKDISP